MYLCQNARVEGNRPSTSICMATEIDTTNEGHKANSLTGGRPFSALRDHRMRDSTSGGIVEACARSRQCLSRGYGLYTDAVHSERRWRHEHDFVAIIFMRCVCNLMTANCPRWGRHANSRRRKLPSTAYRPATEEYYKQHLLSQSSHPL